jgi:homocysteine S-methyltransferase
VTLAEALATGGLVLDGAYGTELARLGYRGAPADLAVLEAADLVARLHAEYAAAGAEAVETCTYQANRWRLPEPDRVEDINRAAARLARAAAPDRFVLGAIGPSGKILAPIGHLDPGEAWNAVAEQAAALDAEGVDGFILETFVDLTELENAVRAVQSVSGRPIIALKAFIEDGEALAEGLPERVARTMAAWNVAAIGANCIVGPQRMLDLVRQMAEATELPVVVLPTPGLPQLVKGQVVYDATPEYFARALRRLRDEGASAVGGCCGTTPAHIRALKEALDRRPPATRTTVSPRMRETTGPEMPATSPTAFAEKLREGRFVAAVELDVPRGLRLDKFVAHARELTAAGADVINISDGARARLRMNPMAVAAILQRDAATETVMHFACRDRNLLAVQADLLGAHALAVRNILAVTGDPANIGDYPSATSVFDVDSIGLCRIMARFNEGVDLAGNRVGVRCGFTICAAFNPESPDPATEEDRLRRKVDAGAQVIYTQPVFDVAGIERCVQIAASLRTPLLIGVLPLRSARHAEFMHHEVPGIRIPETLRAQLAEANSDDDALTIGMEAAAALAGCIRRQAQGLYLMPPAGRADLAARLLGGT